MKVGITGGIGAGKSLVCKIFELYGWKVYYSDDRAKYLMNHDKELVMGIKSILGEESYVNGNLNRSFIANRIFNNQDLLKKVNHLVHPAVRKDFKQFSQKYENVINEAALLVENGSHKELDKLIVVSAPRELQINRVRARDLCTEEEVESRMSKQLSNEKREAVADFIITNDNNQSLLEQVQAILNQIGY